MRLRSMGAALAAVVLCILPGWGANGPGAQQPAPRPTLGPPTLNNPTSAYTNDPKKLLRVHTIYVERIDNGLTGQLGEELDASHRFRVVKKKRDADAVLRGTCFDSRRLRNLHSEVFLSDRVTGKPIWQDDIHQTVDPPSLKQAVSRTANVIVRHLMASVVKAEQP